MNLAEYLSDDLVEPIVYLVPSRGRPRNAVDLVQAWNGTLSSVPCCSLVIALDDDDPELERYQAELEDRPEWCEVYVGPRRRLGGTLNALASTFAADRTAVGFMGDDHRPRTQAWDELLLELHHETPLAVVYGNDLVRGADLPTAVSIAAEVVTELGYFVPPGAVHLYLDDYWKALGSDLGTLRYCPELVIEHLHPTAGTAPSDAGYLEVNRPELYRQDEQTFHRHMATRHPADIDRLRELRRAL